MVSAKPQGARGAMAAFKQMDAANPGPKVKYVFILFHILVHFNVVRLLFKLIDSRLVMQFLSIYCEKTKIGAMNMNY
jgi:hypothetical protein